MNKYVQRLRKIEGAITERFDPWQPSNLVKSSSPGVNWLYGNNQGFPRGFTTLLWGEQKSGKSLLSYDWIGQVHKSDPEALAIKFDTEYRDDAQLTTESAAMFGIDMERYIPIQNNEPTIFDEIKETIASVNQDGGKVRIIVIDSVNAILGRREADQETVTQHQIGDNAATLQVALKAIRKTIHDQRIALVLTAHARDEMDQLEIKRGNKKKVGVANAVKHNCEFFLNVSRNRNKDGKKNLLDQELVDNTKKDMDDDAELTGHRIKVWMQANTMGVDNRVAEFTFDYKRGIINTHEEVFKLGLKWGIIKRPNLQTYVVGSDKFRGLPDCLEALRTRPDLQKTILAQLIEREKVGAVPILTAEDAKAELDSEEVAE